MLEKGPFNACTFACIRFDTVMHFKRKCCWEKGAKAKSLTQIEFIEKRKLRENKFNKLKIIVYLNIIIKNRTTPSK